MKKSELLLNPYKEHLKKPYLHGAGILEINGVQYSADEYITMLEEENRKLKERIKKLEEQRIFSLGEYDYMILTSTTPQLKLIKKNNSDLYSNITVGTTQK